MANGHNEENFVEQFENLQLNTHQLRDEETRSSARSRQTMFSTASKKKSNGNYKFGSRPKNEFQHFLKYFLFIKLVLSFRS